MVGDIILIDIGLYGRVFSDIDNVIFIYENMSNSFIDSEILLSIVLPISSTIRLMSNI